MSAQHTRHDRHLMWTQLGDLWEQVQGYLAMLAVTIVTGGGAVLFGLAVARTAGKAPALTFTTLLGLGLVAFVAWRWRVAGRRNATLTDEQVAEHARAVVARSLALIDAPPGYAEVWDRHAGCKVCSQCGAPVAAEPCPTHGPAATDAAAQETQA
ncbi:hypothetical protein JOF56_011642 [Kibdelosporangium banguiense]|uniref:Uncharacterized protein n=1 Tax=Kibdelosporangium banguiense TaxID=1365924 RepID=A0ABS4U3L4_9PSEU|nr:hypothetical protein [Kibdelosporangium banguiense]MBP2331257.1 hypothetical protein [Kibdelosporangium banguiense]